MPGQGTQISESPISMSNDTAVLTETQIAAVEAVPAAAAPVHKPIGLRAYAGTFATCVLIQGLTVVQGIIIARLLGPVGRGEYAAVILWPSVFAAIGIFGTNVALARAVARRSSLVSRISQ